MTNLDSNHGDTAGTAKSKIPFFVAPIVSLWLKKLLPFAVPAVSPW